MTTILLLDAAFPPAPDQWLRDMDAVGAQGGAIYVYGGILNYSKAHVDAARAAGKQVLPIIVTGDSPPAPPLYAAAAPYGITSGLLVYDIESGSQPGPAWVQQGVQQSNAAGWDAGVYSTASFRQSYPYGWWWEARWPYPAGIWQPIPTLPSGQIGWQYAHDVTINGSMYDISIFDTSIFGGGDGVAFGDDDIAAALADIMYFATLYRASQVGDIDHWVGVAKQRGLRAMVEEFWGSPEPQQNAADITKILSEFRGGTLGGPQTGVAPHKHSGGTTGDVQP